MELIKIVNARKTLDEFSDKEDIPAHLAYWMTKFIAKTTSDYEFYAGEMSKLFYKFAEKKDDDTFVVLSEKVEEFNAEAEKIAKTDAEDPGIKFKLSEMSAGLKLSMKQMYPLLDFIEENE